VLIQAAPIDREPPLPEKAIPASAIELWGGGAAYRTRTCGPIITKTAEQKKKFKYFHRLSWFPLPTLAVHPKTA